MLELFQFCRVSVPPHQRNVKAIQHIFGCIALGLVVQ
jgi:hypothetical protein